MSRTTRVNRSKGPQSLASTSAAPAPRAAMPPHTETEIIDQASFNEFSSKVPATMQAFGGKFLVRGGKVTALEGDAPKRVIVTAFDSVEKAQAWRNSAGWKDLQPFRPKG